MLWNNLELPPAYYQDNHVTLYNHDCRLMTELPDGSIQCVVTSPPYWGLRKYAGEQDLIWGGDNHHEHEWKKTPPRRTRSVNDVINPDSIQAKHIGTLYEAEGGNVCSICGAWRGAFGLEPTPELYVHHTIEILREIRRVLRKDGVVFWNIGDSYAGGGNNRGNGKPLFDKQASNRGTSFCMETPQRKPVGIIKAKDLCLIPFRVAIAAQEDGWWVRSDIIWSKNNPMPESVTDRPTESHEHILMFTKSARYYWDIDAVREPHLTEPGKLRDKRNEGYGNAYLSPIGAGLRTGYSENGRNIRSVWEFSTQPYPEAHFATFPEALPERCIKAATPEYGCCALCGAPWERIIEHKNMEIRRTDWGDNAGNRTASSGTMISPAETKTIGWQPSCKCNTDKSPMPSVILDPFCGSGTSLWVAKTLNRKAVGYEISKEYCELAMKRNFQQVGL